MSGDYAEEEVAAHEFDLPEREEIELQPASESCNCKSIQEQRDILLAAVTDAIARFDKVHWGWDGDCGSSFIMRDLENARDAVLTLNSVISVKNEERIDHEQSRP
jgi:hypothetical protein